MVTKRSLAIAEENEFDFLNKNGTPELLNIIKKHRNEDLFFVITNQALYPFADWNIKEQKGVINNALGIGNGP